MTLSIANTWTVLCLLTLCACTAQPVKAPPPNILALTGPIPATSQRIDELRTEEDETIFVIEANAVMQKCYADRVRIREFLQTDFAPKPWWKFGK